MKRFCCPSVSTVVILIVTLCSCIVAIGLTNVRAQPLDSDEILLVFDSKVKFTDFKVRMYKGKTAKFDINSSHTARLYRTALREGYKTLGTNFGGHYTLIEWGCGSPCHEGALIDIKTGKVYDIPGSGIGWDFKPDSRMLIVNPPCVDLLNGKLYYIASRPYEAPSIYIFNEHTKRFRLHRNWPYKMN